MDPALLAVLISPVRYVGSMKACWHSQPSNVKKHDFRVRIIVLNRSKEIVLQEASWHWKGFYMVILKGNEVRKQTKFHTVFPNQT